VFRGKLLAFLTQSYRHDELCFSGTVSGTLALRRTDHEATTVKVKKDW
jgi:hypothetical protein